MEGWKEAIVEQCQHAKLVWRRELYIDGTKVQANASKDSLKPRFFVEAHLSTLFSDHPEDATGEGEQDARQDESAAAEPSPQGEKSSLVESPTSLSPEQRFELTQQNEERHKWIEQLGAQDRRASSRVYQRMADYLVSTTDPDATLMETTKGADMGYRTHYVVDGGKARIILGILVTPSEVMDNQPMRDLIFRTCFRYKLRPRYVRGDTKYGTTDNIVALEREHIRAYVPIADLTQRTPFFRQEDFQYDARLGAASVPSRGDVCLLFGGLWVVYSSLSRRRARCKRRSSAPIVSCRRSAASRWGNSAR